MNSKIRFDLNSIRFRLWLYFLIFGIIVLGTIWVFQTYMLHNGYEKMKVDEVEEVGEYIYKAYTDGDEGLTQTIQSLSVTNDMYVMMEYNDALLLFSPEQESAVPVYKYRNELPELKATLPDTAAPGESSWYSFSTAIEKYNTLAYTLILDKVVPEEGSSKGLLLAPEDGSESAPFVLSDGGVVRLYIFSPLYPVDSTITILTDQLFRVSIIALFLAFLMALFFSRRIARPINKMTATAKQMGAGDYNVKFEGKSFTEVNNLAHTLNLTAYELGMADTRQKDLIANVSHDLKTPLTMTKSYAEMIRDLSGDNPEKRNEHLQVIIEESDRMSRLVGDMATISAMQTKKMVLEKSIFDLTKTAASILASYDILQEQEGYKFEFNAPNDCMVYADEDRIKQVISNLTSNAVKYCGDDKVVLVSIKRAGRKYRLEVSDHGPGIKPEEIPHVWDRYYKTSSNYVRETSGTGLGLSIVKEILTIHNAQYGVVSRVDQGSTFWFELDIVKKQS